MVGGQGLNCLMVGRLCGGWARVKLSDGGRLCGGSAGVKLSDGG